MSLTAAAPTPAELARRVKVMPEGIDPFDVQQASLDVGVDALVFTGPPEAAARLVEAGFAPVAFVDRPGNTRHAVTVTGAERGRASDGECSTALVAVELFDPLTDRRTWMPAQAFADRQSGQQLMVFFDPDQRKRLGASGFPLVAAEAVDRRFRAQGWLNRARSHPRPNAQSVRLLERAVAADPEWAAAQDELDRHRAAQSRR